MRPTRIPWARVTAEFAVIFVGVTLSLAADDWRQDREDRKREQAVLAEMLSDLQADSSELESMRRRLEIWDQSAVWLRRHVDRSSVVPDTVLAHIGRLGLFDLYQPVSATYVALTDGAELDLIQDAYLRRQVVDYYEVSQPYMLQFAERLGDDHNRYHDLMFDHASFVLPDTASSSWPVRGLEFSTSVSAFRHDPRMRPTVTRLGTNAANWAVRIGEVLKVNSDLQASIAQAMRYRP